MALSGAIPVSNEQVFPNGAWMEGEVRQVKDFQRSKPKSGDTPAEEVQQVQRDPDGQPVTDDMGNPIRIWEIDVYDDDPKAFDKRTKVKIYAARQPVPPDGLGDSPFRRVEFVDLAVQPWVNQQPCKGPEDATRHKCRARQGFSYRASDIRAPSAATAERPAKAASGNGRN